MIFEAIEEVLRALTGAGVRFLVVGGVAVNAHGYQRLTHDLDLVVELLPDNVARALGALESLGYRPVLPVPAEGFANAEVRRRWREERNLQVFSLTRGDLRGLTVDILAEEPFALDAELDRALIAEVGQGLRVPFVSLRTLIDMKERAGRPRDQDDVQHLRWILDKEATDE